MNIDQYINESKINIFFEDVNLPNRIHEIDDSTIDLSKYIKAFSKFTEEIIVIGNTKHKDSIFLCAMECSISIKYISIGKLRTGNYEINFFRGKNIILEDCFIGTTQTTNKTFIAIKNIIEVSKRFIAVTSISERYILPEYFINFIKLKNINTPSYYELGNLPRLTKILKENIIIIKDNTIYTGDVQKYWRLDYGEAFRYDQDSRVEKEQNTVRESEINNTYYNNVAQEKGIVNSNNQTNTDIVNRLKNMYLKDDICLNEEHQKKSLVITSFYEKLNNLNDNNNEKKQYILYFILSLFGYVFIAGIQHFAQKKYIKGSIYLLTFGLLFIGTTYDVLSYGKKAFIDN